VIGLARNKAELEAKLKEAKLTTVTVLEADVGDLASLKVRELNVVVAYKEEQTNADPS
jgi:hypothetical protein